MLTAFFIGYACVNVVIFLAYFYIIHTAPVNKNEDGREAEERVHEIEDSVRGGLE